MQNIDSIDLSNVVGGQVPGQINQPQAVAAGAQGAQTGGNVGQAIGTGLGAALPGGLGQPANAAVGGAIGRGAGQVAGAAIGYGNNVYNQVRGWFR